MQVGGPFDEVGAGVDVAGGFVEHAAVGAFAAADEEHHVVAGCETADVGQAVGHLAADGVERAEAGGWFHMGGQPGHDVAEAFEGFRRLREEVDVAPRVQALCCLVGRFDDDGAPVGLANEAEHLGVAGFAVDGYLGVGACFVHLADAPLQAQHDGARGVDELDAAGGGQRIGGGRFAVGTQQHARTGGQRREHGVVDRDESQPAQAVALAAVVYDVAQAVEAAVARELFLGLADGCGHAEAEARAFVDFNGQSFFNWQLAIVIQLTIAVRLGFAACVGWGGAMGCLSVHGFRW